MYKNRETDWFPNPLVRSNSSHSKFLKNGVENSNLDKSKNVSFFFKEREDLPQDILSKNSVFHLAPFFELNC